MQDIAYADSFIKYLIITALQLTNSPIDNNLSLIKIAWNSYEIYTKCKYIFWVFIEPSVKKQFLN